MLRVFPAFFSSLLPSKMAGTRSPAGQCPGRSGGRRAGRENSGKQCKNSGIAKTHRGKAEGGRSGRGTPPDLLIKQNSPNTSDIKSEFVEFPSEYYLSRFRHISHYKIPNTFPAGFTINFLFRTEKNGFSRSDPTRFCCRLRRGILIQFALIISPFHIQLPGNAGRFFRGFRALSPPSPLPPPPPGAKGGASRSRGGRICENFEK